MISLPAGLTIKPKYISSRPEPAATFVDAFTLNCAEFTKGFAFPPFLFGQQMSAEDCTRKSNLNNCGALFDHTGLVYTFTKLLIVHPTLIGVTKHFVSNPLLSSVQPLSSKPLLLARKASGIASLTGGNFVCACHNSRGIRKRVLGRLNKKYDFRVVLGVFRTGFSSTQIFFVRRRINCFL